LLLEPRMTWGDFKPDRYDRFDIPIAVLASLEAWFIKTHLKIIAFYLDNYTLKNHLAQEHSLAHNQHVHWLVSSFIRECEGL